jgi:CRISPR-associated protein Csb1
MTEPLTATHDIIKSWADDPKGPVALHLKQKLLPVEGEGGLIFPPTYADIGYNIDTLSDGTKVVNVDSVGSQANRMEPIFKREPYAALVPQVTLQLGNEKSISLVDVGHRLGDAIVRASDLANEAEQAFLDYQRNNDPSPIAKLAPTSLVFGVWDSRGEGAKLPRLVSATIRASDVDILHRAATYVPAADFADDALLGPHDDDKAEKDARSALGFQHAPATWTSNDKIPEYRDGKPNNERRILGGVIARGGIYREVTVNLVALRNLGGPTPQPLRYYILGLTLVAANNHSEEFLRQGCLLTLAPKEQANWVMVERSGTRPLIVFNTGDPLKFAKEAATNFGVASPHTFHFDKARARQLVDEQKGGKKKSARQRKGKGLEEGAQESSED